jgi:glycosyltransferase involved in cell wall biosynthesis
VDVASRQSEPADEEWFRSQVPDLELFTFRGYRKHGSAFSPLLLKWLYQRAKHYDVIEVFALFNWISSLSAATIAALGRPLVICPWGMLSKYTLTHGHFYLKRFYFRLLDGPNLCRAQAVHVETEGERAEAALICPRLEQALQVVPPPFNSAAECDVRHNRQVAQTVLFLSRLDRKKNLELLIDSWGKVQRSIPYARLIVAGDGDPYYVSTLKKRAASIARGHKIIFTGFVAGDAKLKIWREGDLFVLPSHHENLGMSVLEAIAMGLPVVISSAVQLAPFIKSERLGVVIEKDETTLADAIIWAMHNTELRRRCAEEGAKIVGETFSRYTIGSQLKAMYSNAIDEVSLHSGSSSSIYRTSKRI